LTVGVEKSIVCHISSSGSVDVPAICVAKVESITVPAAIPYRPISVPFSHIIAPSSILTWNVQSTIVSTSYA